MVDVDAVCENDHIHNSYLDKGYTSKPGTIKNNMWIFMLLMAMILSMSQGSPIEGTTNTASSIPLIQLITMMHGNKTNKTVRRDTIHKRKQDISKSLYEHNCRCHFPHDPENCESCLRARMMAKKNTKNDEWGDIHRGFRLFRFLCLDS